MSHTPVNDLERLELFMEGLDGLASEYFDNIDRLDLDIMLRKMKVKILTRAANLPDLERVVE